MYGGNHTALTKENCTLEQAMKFRRGVVVYFCSFFDIGGGWGSVVNTTPLPR